MEIVKILELHKASHGRDPLSEIMVGLYQNIYGVYLM